MYLAAIPLGGYVKMVGEEPGASIDPDDQKRFFYPQVIAAKNVSLLQPDLFLIFLLAILIFYVLYQFSGSLPMAKPIVGKVT